MGTRQVDFIDASRANCKIIDREWGAQQLDFVDSYRELQIYGLRVGARQLIFLMPLMRIASLWAENGNSTTRL